MSSVFSSPATSATPVTPSSLPTRLAFVDLETTGAQLGFDGITEVGIVEVDEAGVREWSSLVNPGKTIPPFVQQLTGITNEMVAGAPSFEELADQIHARLQDRVFVAHNARFDHGFLRQAFAATGHAFRPPVLCTVRLSRKLQPQHAKHNLDSLIERHGLQVEQKERHRALGDARLIWQLWQRLRAQHAEGDMAEAVLGLIRQPSLPPRLDPALLEDLPKTSGVYLFRGAQGCLLYVGKATNLRRRVLSHFSGDHASGRELELCQQVEGIEWTETAGELGALLLESQWVKQLQPAHNRLLRASEDWCAWRLLPKAGRLQASIAKPLDLFFSQEADLYGLFSSPRAAKQALRGLAESHQLCLQLLGLDAQKGSRGCFASQVGKCSGACDGRESLASHDARAREALSALKLAPWPYAGAVALREEADWLVLDAWSFVGRAANREEAQQVAANASPTFDRDVYQLLHKRLADLKPRIVQLD